jgi:hypothetical protein
MAPRLPFTRRIFKHPRAMHYNRLVALVTTINLGSAGYGATAANWWTSDGTDLGAVALAAQVNLAAAVLFRQQYLLNALAWLVTRPPTSWPLRVRWALGKYYHFVMALPRLRAARHDRFEARARPPTGQLRSVSPGLGDEESAPDLR